MKVYLAVFGLLTVVFLTAFWVWIAHKVTFSGDLSKVRSPLVIFDFDGTICPSYPLFIDQVNALADEYHLRKIEEEEVEVFRSMDPISIMKTLGVSMFKLPFLLRRARQNAQKQLLELEPVPGIVEVLRALKFQGYSLGILTSNSEENVSLYLMRHEIDCFDFICAGNNIFGKEKHLRTILRKTHLTQARVVYVGDETRDIEAAQKAQLVSIGVSWGYNTTNVLRQSVPHFLCETPSHLISFINRANES